MTRRKTPYDHLLARFHLLANRVQFPRRREMFVLPKDKLGTTGWHFADIAQHVQAADRLGWDVRLRWDVQQGLVIEYTERVVVP